MGKRQHREKAIWLTFTLFLHGVHIDGETTLCMGEQLFTPDLLDARATSISNVLSDSWEFFFWNTDFVTANCEGLNHRLTPGLSVMMYPPTPFKVTLNVMNDNKWIQNVTWPNLFVRHHLNDWWLTAIERAINNYNLSRNHTQIHPLRYHAWTHFAREIFPYFLYTWLICWTLSVLMHYY